MRLVERSTKPRTAPRHQLSRVEREKILDAVWPAASKWPAGGGDVLILRDVAISTSAPPLMRGSFRVGTGLSVNPHAFDLDQGYDIQVVGVGDVAAGIWDVLGTVILDQAIVPATARESTAATDLNALAVDEDARLDAAIHALMHETTEREVAVTDEQRPRLRYRYPRK